MIGRKKFCNLYQMFSKNPILKSRSDFVIGTAFYCMPPLSINTFFYPKKCNLQPATLRQLDTTQNVYLLFVFTKSIVYQCFNKKKAY
jgi:hypothetical protein